MLRKKEGDAGLKKKLKVAGVRKTPAEFLSLCRKAALMVGVTMAVLSFLLLSKQGGSMLLVLPIALFFAMMTYITFIKSIDAKISKRAKEIDRDVLFAGRFLLIKINSGKPLINSLVEASRSYGVSSSYFKEIVRNIDLGTPLEDALDQAMENCPSKKMKRILFQINNALKIGVDVTQNLDMVIQEISHEQLIEIQRYGKKLSSLTMFYMLLAVVLPSLGMTMFVIVASLVSLNLSAAAFFVFSFFLVIIELVFMSLFKSIRPSVNI